MRLRFDIPGNFTVDEVITFINDFNFDEKTAHLIHAFWAPFKSIDPSGQFGKGFIGTSALNVAFACLRNAKTNSLGFAQKNYPIAGKQWPVNRSGITQVTTPNSNKLDALARACINPVIREVYTGGGRTVFRDSLTQAKVETSLRKLISVVDMSTEIDDTVTKYGKDCLQLPMTVALTKYRNFLENYFKDAQYSDWLIPSNDPSMDGKAWKFDVRPNAAKPYDKMDVSYSLHYDGTLRQVVVTQTLTK